MLFVTDVFTWARWAVLSVLSTPRRFCAFTTPTAAAPPLPTASAPTPTPASAVCVFSESIAIGPELVRFTFDKAVVVFPSAVLKASPPPPARAMPTKDTETLTETAADVASKL